MSKIDENNEFATFDDEDGDEFAEYYVCQICGHTQRDKNGDCCENCGMDYCMEGVF